MLIDQQLHAKFGYKILGDPQFHQRQSQELYTDGRPRRLCFCLKQSVINIGKKCLNEYTSLLVEIN